MIITISPPKIVEKRISGHVSLKTTIRDKQRQLYKITYLKRLPLSSMLWLVDWVKSTWNVWLMQLSDFRQPPFHSGPRYPFKSREVSEDFTLAVAGLHLHS